MCNSRKKNKFIRETVRTQGRMKYKRNERDRKNGWGEKRTM